MRNGIGDVVERVDRRAPGVTRFLSALRWGGLRTVSPDPWIWGAEAAIAVGVGVVLRAGVRSASSGRARVPVVPAVATSWLAVHAALWRWDTLRWRRRRVALVVDLPLDDVVALAERLVAAGLAVERWERGVRGGSRVHGLWCRAGDVRAVNGAIDVARQN